MLNTLAAGKCAEDPHSGTVSSQLLLPVPVISRGLARWMENV